MARIHRRKKRMLQAIALQMVTSTIVFSLAFPSFGNAPHDESDDSTSTLRPLIERYKTDRVSLSRMYDVPLSEVQKARFTAFYKDWIGKLQAVDFDDLDQEGQVDYLLFDNHLRDRLRDLAIGEKQDAELSTLLPFAKNHCRPR